MRSKKSEHASLFKNSFWHRRGDWPKDHPGYVFLARALDEICAAVHGAQWLRPVEEPKEKPKKPADDCKDEAVWDAFEDEEDQYDLARERDELEIQKKRQGIAREIAQEREAGIVSALRRESGGRLVKLKKHFWNTENFLHRFVNCQMSLDDPFAVNYPFSDTSWIYLTRDSLTDT